MKSAIIYQAANGAIELRTDIKQETLWANLDQIASVFERDKSVISRHIKSIFATEELDEKVVVAKNATTTKHGAIKGKTQTKQVEYYNLDMIISVGYRVNSKTATRFRQRATSTLKQHITNGYTINPQRIEQNYTAFLQAVEEVKSLVHTASTLRHDDILELIKSFAHTWFSLDSYDRGAMPQTGHTQQTIRIEARELSEAIMQLKQDLMTKNEASELFAQEKNHGGVEGIVGNVFQSVFGKDAYPSIEEKAAHLLYFMVKNHPFTDGNKRSGAFSFLWLLHKGGIDFRARISPETLTTLTLLIAESQATDKDRVIGMVLLLLQGR